MLYLIAQATTQQAAGKWTAEDVIQVITAVAVVLIPALALTLFPAIIALIKAMKNSGRMDEQSKSIDRISQGLHSTQATVTGLASSLPPTTNGAPGPAGPTGATGATGATGPTGAAGQPGAVAHADNITVTAETATVSANEVNRSAP